jgi:hypothetical protein
MGFLRRLLGGEQPERTNGANPAATNAVEAGPASAADADEAERAHERDVMTAENERLDELKRRQLKYADRSWTPPAQGGERRADDADRPDEG